MDRTQDPATPEDVILYKLEWSKLGSSERQRTDALQVANTQGKTLYLNYTEKWARELSVVDIWKRIREVVFPEHNQEGASNV